jgi:GNAT superfamily N-acetyltransferase
MPEVDSSATWRAAAATPIVAGPDQGEQAAGVLARAFASDPLVDWFVRAGTGRDRSLLGMMRGILYGYTLALNEVFLATDGGACAVWLPAEEVAAPMTLADHLDRAWRVLPTSGLVRYPRILRLIYAMERHHPAEPLHAYLWLLGVEPARHGHGIGSALLDTNLRRYDRIGVPTYLENSNPRNSPFYKRHGYRSRGEFRATPTAPPLEAMWCELGGR